MKKIAILIALTMCLATATARATTYIEGPSSDYVYAEFGVDDYDQTIDRIEWIDNWSVTSPAPYATRYVHYTPTWSLVLGYSTNFVCDTYAFGSYTQCINEYEYRGTTYLTWTPPPNPLTAPLTWPQNCVGQTGYQYNYIAMFADGKRHDGYVSSGKRFRIGGDGFHQYLVWFKVQASAINPVTGEQTVLNPATSTFYINNKPCDTSGFCVFTWPADDAWHSLYVAVAGQYNIRYTVQFWTSIQM